MSEVASFSRCASSADDAGIRDHGFFKGLPLRGLVPVPEGLSFEPQLLVQRRALRPVRRVSARLPLSRRLHACGACVGGLSAGLPRGCAAARHRRGAARS
jgi:hypothetical protein